MPSCGFDPVNTCPSFMSNDKWTHHCPSRHRYFQSNRSQSATQKDIFPPISNHHTSVKRHLLVSAKKMMNPAKLVFRISSGIQGKAKSKQGATIHSDPNLSARSPTIGPVTNVGAEAMTLIAIHQYMIREIRTSTCDK